MQYFYYRKIIRNKTAKDKTLVKIKTAEELGKQSK